jgi:hypothetical protein
MGIPPCERAYTRTRWSTPFSKSDFYLINTIERYITNFGLALRQKQPEKALNEAKHPNDLNKSEVMSSLLHMLPYSYPETPEGTRLDPVPVVRLEVRGYERLICLTACFALSVKLQ